MMRMELRSVRLGKRTVSRNYMGINITIRGVQGKGAASQREQAIHNESPAVVLDKNSVTSLRPYVAKMFANRHKSLSMDLRFVHVSLSGVKEILP